MPDKPISDSWVHGDRYEQYIGRWSRQLAPLFLRWIDCAAGLRWLDVGCGTGALCAAILDGCAPEQVSGVEPAAGFLKTARERLAGRAGLCQGTAGRIPLAASAVDGAVAGLVLNFVPDPLAALVEMARVTRDGGRVGAYVWDYAGKMELLRYFWDAAAALDPQAARLDEGPRFPMCRPEGLAALFTSAGLTEVEVTAIDLLTPFADFEDFWQPFLGGQGPAPAYVMALEETARARLRERLRQSLPVQADGSITLTARAWAARARVVKPLQQGEGDR